MKTIKTNGYTIIGYSKAREATSFYIQELNICLDMGCKPLKGFKLDAVFISHTHLDHCKEVKEFKIKNGTLDVYVPYTAPLYFENLIKAMNELNYSKDLKETTGRSPYLFMPVKNNTVIILKDYEVHVISLDHSVNTNGYLFYHNSKRLKEEFKNKKANELKELRKNNIIIEEEYLKEEFAYLLDTTHQVFQEHNFSKFKFIICECTFIKKEDKERAIQTKHMHWDDLKVYVEKYNNITFILTHFSKRYTEDFINEIFKDIKNVIVF
jgi:ribonuclease Z